MAILGDTKAVSLTLLDGVISDLNPLTTNTYTLGTSSLKWENVYSTTFTGDLSGNATTSSGVKDYNNNTTITFGYSTNGMTSTSWLGSWEGYRLRAISPANAVKSGVGASAIGSSTKPVYWTGSAFSAISSYEGNADTANSLNFSHTNEIFLGVNSTSQSRIWINYRRTINGAASGNTAITEYRFGNGNANTTGVTLYADNFTGNAATATALTSNAGNISKPIYFSGGKPVATSGWAVEYIEGTQTAATGSWTGVTKDASLEKGKVIVYKLPYNGSGNATLNLTLAGGGTTGAIAIYVSGNTRLTTHYTAGSIITLTYDGTYWRGADYWNSNSRDPGYGKITPGTASTATTGITANTTQITAKTYNEALTINPGNKWIQLAGSESATAGSDSFTIAHTVPASISNTGPTTAQTPGYGATFNIPVISTDAAGHVTGVSTTTVKIPASDNTNTDTKVTQTNTTDTGTYRILFSESASDTTTTEGARKNTNLKYTPSSGKLSCTALEASTNIYAGPWWFESNNGLGNEDWEDYFITYDSNSGNLNASFDNLSITKINGATVGSSPKFTDENVAQTNTTTGNSAYRLLFSGTADNTPRTEGARKNDNLTFNPSTNTLTTTNFSVTKINGATVGSTPNFVTSEGTNTSGSMKWHYRHWSNGRQEAWGMQDFSATSAKYVEASGTIPSTVIAQTNPKFIYASGYFTGTTDSHIGYTYCSNAGAFDVYLHRSTTNSVTARIYVYVECNTSV